MASSSGAQRVVASDLLDQPEKIPGGKFLDHLAGILLVEDALQDLPAAEAVELTQEPFSREAGISTLLSGDVGFDGGFMARPAAPPGCFFVFERKAPGEG